MCTLQQAAISIPNAQSQASSPRLHVIHDAVEVRCCLDCVPLQATQAPYQPRLYYRNQHPAFPTKYGLQVPTCWSSESLLLNDMLDIAGNIIGNLLRQVPDLAEEPLHFSTSQGRSTRLIA